MSAIAQSCFEKSLWYELRASGTSRRIKSRRSRYSALASSALSIWPSMALSAHWRGIRAAASACVETTSTSLSFTTNASITDKPLFLTRSNASSVVVLRFDQSLYGVANTFSTPTFLLTPSPCLFGLNEMPRRHYGPSTILTKVA